MASKRWNYFKKKSCTTVICNICNQTMSCKGSSTPPLIRHLTAVHHIKKEILDTTANTENSEETPPFHLVKYLKIISSYKNKMRKDICKMAAVDYITLNTIASSKTLRNLFHTKGNSNFPTSNTTIAKIISDSAS